MKKKVKTVSIYILCLMVMASFIINKQVVSYAASQYFTGEGTEASPYQISTAVDLVQLATLVNAGNVDYNSKYYEMQNDIDLSGITNWTPIGSSSSFNGTFSGSGHQIRNLNINTTYDGESNQYLGLFDTNTGTIKHLQLLNANFQIKGSGFTAIGGIVVTNKGVIDSCSTSGIIESSSTDDSTDIGGIAYDNYGTITNCKNLLEVSSTSLAAGIAVWNNSIITSCTNNGLINGNSAAGISIRSLSSITNSKNYGEINGKSAAAGITVNNEHGTISKCLNDGAVMANSTVKDSRALAAGIASFNDYGTISECSNNVSVNLQGLSPNNGYPSSAAGGIVGINYESGEISNCSNSGLVNCRIRSGDTGGIVGSFYGGSGSLKNCFNSGAISGQTTRIGGIAGTILYGLVENCYYLDNISNGIGCGNGAALSCTIEQMYKQSTYVGFDFTKIWTMPISGYLPVLQDLYIPLQSTSIDNFNMVTGESRQAPLVFNPDDATIKDCTWTSSNPVIVSVDQYGIVTGHAVGSATLFVESKEGGYIDSCSVTVRQGVQTISLISSLSLKTDTSMQLAATVLPESAYDKTLKWSSSNSAIAQVDQSGNVTGIAPGSAVINVKAGDANKVSASCTVTVIRPVTGISIAETSPTVSVGSQTMLTINAAPGDASNKSVKCSSSDTSIATVNNSGVVTGISRGYATITATTADGGFSVSRQVEVIQPVVGITLDHSSTGVALGKQIKLTAAIVPVNANNQNIIWSSNHEAVATVNNEGVVSGINTGSAIITVKSEDGGHSAYCAVTVGQGATNIEVTGPDQVDRNSSIQMSAAVYPGTAVNANIRWSVMPGTGSGTINANGLLTGTNPGTVTVIATAADGTGITGEKTITVNEKICKIIFNKSGGNTEANPITESAIYNGTIIPPTSNPTKTGYAFGGWYKETGCINVWDFATNKVTSDITLYARWVTYLSIPASPKAASSGYNSILINWAAVSGASGYELYRSNSSNGSYIKAGETTAASYINCGLATGTTYYYKVRAYKTSGVSRIYGSFSFIVNAKQIPSTPTYIKATRNNSKRVKLTWSVVTRASGYEIYRSTSKTGAYSLLTRTTYLYYTNSGLITGKTYYYKIRSYQNVGTKRVYSNWTAEVYARPYKK